MTTSTRDALKHDTIELVANQIYDKLTISFNNTRKRLGIQKGIPIVEPIRNYDNFKLNRRWRNILRIQENSNRPW